MSVALLLSLPRLLHLPPSFQVRAQIESVGWNKVEQTEQSTGPILLGTSSGEEEGEVGEKGDGEGESQARETGEGDRWDGGGSNETFFSH